MNVNELLTLLRDWALHLNTIIADTPPIEMAAAAMAPMLGLLIGIRLNRYIDSLPNRTLHAKLIDFTAPLISPVLAIIFTALAMSAYIHSGHKPFVLLFVFKLAIAWLAVHIVSIMSSGRTAAWFIGFVIIPITLLHLFDVWEPIERTATDLEFHIGSATVSLYQVLHAAFALIILMAVTNFTVGTIDQRLRRLRNLRTSSRTLILKFTQIGLYIVVLLIGMRIVGVSLTTLSVFSGALGVGIGFGLQKIASNFISGIILLFERTIEVGDLIQLDNGIQGFVRQTSARYTRIETFDGKDMMIPNEQFITQQVTNLTHTTRRGRIDISVSVGYNDDVALALKLLVKAAYVSPRCLRDPAPGSYITGFGESGINLWLIFWVEDIAEGTLTPRTEITLAILKLFKENGITIPYPHQVQVADPMFEGRMAVIESKLAAAEVAAKSKPKAAKS